MASSVQLCLSFLSDKVADLDAGKRNVLILDRDLAFAFWLGQALDLAGYDAFPAKSCEDATELLTHLNVSIDLLVVGCASPGVVALANALRRSRPHFKVLVAVAEGEEPTSIFAEADAVQSKPSSAISASKTEWLRTIKSLLSRDYFAASNP